LVWLLWIGFGFGFIVHAWKLFPVTPVYLAGFLVEFPLLPLVVWALCPCLCHSS